MKRIIISLLCIAVIVCSAFSVVDAMGIDPLSVNLSNINVNLIKSSSPKEKIINVPKICQYPELPTGCESVSATMVLQHYGENVSATTFATQWLACSNEFYYGAEGLCGPDPNVVFAGNPTKSASYGCYAGPIVNAINNNSTKCRAKEISSKSVKDLCKKYIDDGHPVLVWATMDMVKSKEGDSWNLPNGKNFVWTSGEHCLVLVGYSDTDYYFNDPLTGGLVHYDKQTVEARFDELGNQAVVISQI